MVIKIFYDHSEYRGVTRLMKGATMGTLEDLREKVMKGKRKETGPLVQQALDEGCDP